jgi:hypothetical protein
MRNYQQRSMPTMMDSASLHHTSGSPNSSEEIGSHHNTPETKLTAFSPEDGRLLPRVAEYKTVRSNLPPAFALGQAQGHPGSTIGLSNTATFGGQDPFITNSSATCRACSPRPHPKLSPGASSFTPLESRQKGCISEPNGNRETGLANLQYQSNISKLGYAPRTSGYNTPVNNLNSEHQRFMMPMSPTGLPVSTSPETALKIEVVPVKIGYFSSDGETSRSLIISDISPRTPSKEVEEFFSVC